jgi:hypothetical protein
VAGVGTTNTTYYAITDSASGDWEVGIGTVTSGTPDTLSRDTVLESSNSDNLVNFGAGQKIVICTQPAEKAVYLDASDQLVIDGTSVTATAAELNYVDGVTSNIQTQLDAKVAKAGDTMTGFLTLHADPTNAFHAATKEYVDTIASASLHYHDPVRVESPVALTATYNNGTSGVGATLTNSGTQAALVIDGVTLNVADRVLVYQQTNAAHNGVYTVTDTGSVSTNWVLTRATDADSAAPSDPNALGTGDAFFVREGDTGAGELYVMNTEGTITFGTTNIMFSQISSAAIYSAGTGLDLTGTVFSHSDTSSQASVNNSNGTVIQDITLDTFGHVTALGSADLDGRYYTETEIDSTVSGLNSAIALKQDAATALTTSTTFGGDVSGTYNAIVVANDSHTHDTRYYTETETGSFFAGTTAITGYNKTNWDTAYGWGNHASAGYLTGNQTITLSGDVSGSGTTAITVTIADDSHNHIISNVDGLQTALDGKLPLTGGTISGDVVFNGGTAAVTINQGGSSGSGEAIIINGSGDIKTVSGGSLFFGEYSYAASTYIRGYDSSTGFLFYVDGGNYSTLNTDYFTHTSDIRSPIFYDSNNTAYYADPASTSNLNSIRNNERYLNNGNHALYERAFDCSANAGQARRHEIARIGIDYNDWNYVGGFEVELTERYYGSGLTKKYTVYYGYVSNSGVHLTHYSGNGANNFRVTVSSEVVVSGDHRYISVYVDVRSYTAVTAVVRTTRHLTTNSTPEVGRTYIFSSPTVTNISDFSADSIVTIPASLSASSDLRSPIFYDSNDTAYYTDPASTSNLNTVQAADAFRSDRFETLNGTFLFRVGTTSGATRHINLSDSTTDPANAAATNAITWGQRTDSQPYYMIHLRSEYNNGYSSHTRLSLAWHTGVEIGGASSYGGTRFFNNSPAIAGAAEIMRVGSGNNDVYINNIGTAGASLRAPIFYDSDDTAYYVNPNSTSNLNGLTVAATITGSISGNAGSVTNGMYLTGSQTVTGDKYFQSNLGPTSGSLVNPSLQVYATSTNSAFMSFHRGGSYAVNMGLDSDNVLRIGGWSAAVNRWQLDMSGNNYVAGSFRAPIFYDLDDTAYYTDPASISVLSGVKAKSAFFHGSTSYWKTRDNSGGTEFVLEYGTSDALADANIKFRVNTGGNATATGSFSAPIFYDSNNTTYRLDPASTSTLATINLEGTLRHNGDTNTYLEFPAADELRLVAGGTENIRFTVSKVLMERNVVPKVYTATLSGIQTPDMDGFNSFVWTLSGNLTLGNPGDEAVGMSGVFVFIQDGTGGRTLSLGSDWESPGGAGITLSTAAGAVDIVPYYVAAVGRIVLGTPQLAFS